jgi:type II secretory pathway component GspD/PulD (secretin)
LKTTIGIHKSAPFSMLSLLLVFSLLFAGVCQAEVEIVKIQFRVAADLIPMVEPMLSPSGKATVDPRTNAILIVDKKEYIEKIRSLLAELDQPAQQVTVRFRFQNEDQSDSSGIAASGKVSGDNWSIGTGKKTRDGVSVRVRDRSLDESRGSESFVTVASGSPARIHVGMDILYTERWAYLCQRYARYGERLVIQRIGTGMEVLPVVSGDRVHIEITPTISYEEKGRPGVIRFVEAATKLSLARRQWVTIGGSSQTSNEVIREILAYGTSKGRSNMAMSLMVE